MATETVNVDVTAITSAITAEAAARVAGDAASVSTAASDATTKANAAQAAAIAAAASDATTKANAAQAAAQAASDPVGSAAAAQAAAIAAASTDATTKAGAAQAAAIAASQPLDTTLTALANMGVPVCLCGTSITLTNQTNALAFLFATIFGPRLDLSTFTEVKFQIGVPTGSASANTPKAILRYFTSYSTTTTDYLNIGTSEVSCSLTTAGIIETAWIPLAAGAIGTNKFLRILISGGDGVADPMTGIATAFFR